MQYKYIICLDSIPQKSDSFAIMIYSCISWLQRYLIFALQWRHNGHDGVSNHQPHHCLLNRLFGCRTKKHQSSASLAFVRGIHREPVNSTHKWPVTRKMFPFDDGIMGKLDSGKFRENKNATYSWSFFTHTPTSISSFASSTKWQFSNTGERVLKQSKIRINFHWIVYMYILQFEAWAIPKITMQVSFTSL